MKQVLYALTAVLISLTALAPLQATAQINVNIIVPSPPPPPMVETAPAPRPGYLWAPGYWGWTGNRHVWTEGHWERVREGQYYERPEWQRDGDKWRLREGGWRKAKKHKKHKHGDDDDDRYEGRDEGNDHRGHFCPPGQAKKGNC